MPTLSILTSQYYAGPYVREFYDRTLAAAQQCADDFEIVFVDDGSPDDGKAKVLELIEHDPRVRLVELTRNFGQHRAVLTGLEHTRGDLVFIVDSDLEEDPELLVEFWKVLGDDRDADLVYGVMERRKGDAVERMGGRIFYFVINLLSELPIEPNVLGARLMTRRYADTLIRIRDAEPFIGVLSAYAGFKQVPVPCRKASKGSTTYSFSRKIALASDAIFSASRKPLTWLAACGAAVAGVGVALAIVFTVQTSKGVPIGVEHTLLASLWFLSGLVLSGLGLVGQYIGRIHIQGKGRPPALVKQVHERPADGDAPSGN